MSAVIYIYLSIIFHVKCYVRRIAIVLLATQHTGQLDIYSNR